MRTHQLFTIAPLLLCFVSGQASAAIVDGGPGAGVDGPQPSQVPSTARALEETGRSIAEAVAHSGEATEIAQAPISDMRLTIPDDLFAPEALMSPPATGVWRTSVASLPLASSTFGQHGFRGRGRRDNDGARAAIILGAVATIAGTAVLVYANRPDCSTNPAAGGCGYGTKVVGGAVLSAGVVSLLVGALTWR